MCAKLLGIISVDFNVTDQRLIRLLVTVRYWRKVGVQLDSKSPIIGLQ
jgi:hypothetical protein